VGVDGIGRSPNGVQVETSLVGLPSVIQADPQRFRHLLPGRCASPLSTRR